MATSEEILNQFGSGLSSLKKGVLVKDLGLIDLEKELKQAQKIVNEYDKKVNASPGFSSAQSDAIYQRDLSINRVLGLSALLTSQAQAYKPIGGVLAGGVSAKEQAVANKYKQFDLNGAVETANAYKAAQTERGGGMNPLAAQLLPLVKKGSSFIPKSATVVAPATTTTIVPVDKRVDVSGRSGMGATIPKAPVVGDDITNDGGGTGTGGGGGGATPKLKKGEVLYDGKKVKVGGSKWQVIIQTEFPGMWDVYNDNPDVQKAVDKAVSEGYYNDEAKVTASLQNTNWFRTTESATRKYRIQESTDPETLKKDIERAMEDVRAASLKLNSGVVLSDATLEKIADDKIKFGLSPQQVINRLGSESVATAAGGGTSQQALRQGTVATGLKTIADDYSQKVDQATLDMFTAEILKGTKTEAQFTDLMKMQATSMFRSLAPQIDKGLDVKTAVSMYSNAAKNVLGIDPTTIDWTQDKWNKALNYQDPKTNEYRTMDSSEWNRHLRSLPEWKKTDAAKNAYRNLALTLASGFGKTL